MPNISNSSMCSLFPLERLLDRVEPDSPGFHWIMSRYYIYGVTDMRARSGTFTTPWNAVSSYRLPLPDLSVPENRTLSELMDLRGHEIYASAKESNKQIMIMWSGGIDSTSVLVSILKAVPFNEHKDRVVVCLSPDSVVENFVFYKKFISKRIPIVHRYTLDFNDDFLNKYILLHGDPGDALFGSSSGKYKHLVEDGRHLRPYRDNVDLLYGCVNSSPKLYPESTGKWLVDKLVANLEETKPERVVTVADWFWWQYVNFKWEGSVWRPFHSTGIRRDHKIPISVKNTKDYLLNTFFNTEYFQRWSYTNINNFFPNGMESHKHEVKNYIFNFDYNESYRRYKTKTFSLSIDLLNGVEKNLWLRPVYHDENWVGYNFLDSGVEEEVLQLLRDFKG